MIASVSDGYGNGGGVGHVTGTVSIAVCHMNNIYEDEMLPIAT